MSLKSINPATEKVIAEYSEDSEEKIQKVLEAAADAYEPWRRKSFNERSIFLNAIAIQLEQSRDELAQLMTDEMGKPITQSEAEVEKCAWVCRYYAENAANFLADEHIKTDASKSYVHYEPLGCIFSIMPWNFPLWQVFRGLAPALMAGNTMVLKHASNVSGCAIAIEEICLKAGLPEGVFQNILCGVPRIKGIIQHPNVAAVTLTGSTPAGKAVASQAGECIKKVVLELGGSDPYLILEDADLESAAKSCAQSRMINGGQSCVAAKRFIVHHSVRKEFEKLFCEAMKQYVPGDPENRGTNLGPLARLDLRDSVHEQVMKSVQDGAKLLMGGTVPEQNGAYYPATVLTDVKEGVCAFDEEVFGPVAAIIEARDEADAIRLANLSEFGLGGAVFTRDLQKGERIASQYIESGNCFVNTFVKSDPRLPFGGVKESGHGREMGSFGIKEFTNIKTVYIA